MDGSHLIERCEEVTGTVLHAVFNVLFEQRVALECMLLKPNMIISGKECASQASVGRSQPRHCAACVATYPRRCPASSLSGGQEDRLASAHLNEINRLPGAKPGSVSPTGAPSRITHWRRGMAGTRTWRPAGRPYTCGPAATVRPVSGSTRTRWRRYRRSLVLRRIAANGATTDIIPI